MTPRYGQLTYTSVATAGNPGGWQVKETSGGLTAAESDLLVAGVRTSLNPVHPLPPYPTAEQRAAFPRRLSYRRFDHSTAAYWHVAPAGVDGSGRRGNVFAHAVLDRRADAGEPRPIQFWRAAHWLTPYGCKAVLAATLRGVEAAPGQAVTAESVVRFVCDRGRRRLGILGVLLDAVAAGVSDSLDSPIVLAVDSVDNAAQWIGAVSYLMSPAAARWLNFSTFDRCADLGYLSGSGRYLASVPRADLHAIPAGFTVIDENAEVDPAGPDGQLHRIAGSRVVATAWSAMVRTGFSDPGAAAQMLAEIDRAASYLADQAAGAELHPALPMAFAVLERPASAQAADIARAFIAAHAPRQLRTEPTVASVVHTAVHHAVGVTTSDAWRAASTTDGLVAATAATVYLQRAIADPEWLARPGPVPAPPSLPATMPDTVTEAVPQALSEASKRGPVGLLALVDLLASVGLVDHLDDLIDQQVVPVLLDEDRGPALLARLADRIRPATRLRVARRVFAARDPSGNSPRLSSEVLSRLADGVAAPDPDDLARARPGDPVWTAATLRGRWAVASSGDPQPGDRYLALWWLRTNGDGHRDGTDRASAALSAADFDCDPWDPAELLVALGDDPLPSDPCARTLVSAPDSPALQTLAERVLTERPGSAAVACAAVRAIPPAAWLAGGYVTTHYRTYAPYWDTVIGDVGVAALHHDFAIPFLVLGALARRAGIPEAEACGALIANRAVAAEAAAEVRAITRSGAQNHRGR